MVTFLFAVAELIEEKALDRARNAVRALMTLAPESASVRESDGSWAEKPAAEVLAGSIVRVRPGERLPLDGVVVAGDSSVNQAPVTGESVPVDKGVGDKVFAGTINESGVLEFRTSGGKDETTLARIIRTVQEAQASRAPTQRFVDSFARVYTPIVCAAALLVAVRSTRSSCAETISGASSRRSSSRSATRSSSTGSPRRSSTTDRADRGPRPDRRTARAD
jgi:Cd2+/Zn2+-exporting ATPase